MTRRALRRREQGRVGIQRRGATRGGDRGADPAALGVDPREDEPMLPVGRLRPGGPSRVRRGASAKPEALEHERPLGIAGGRRSGLAHAHFFLDRHEEALRWGEGHLRDNPNALPAFRICAASAAFAGKMDQAQRFAAGLKQIDPAFRVSRLEDYLGPYQHEVLEKYKQGLRLAGLPE